MVAYHFPPFGLSSGVQRTLKFSEYLPEFGWQPIVLTAQPRAYVAVRDDQMKEIAPDLVVRRAFALDTARHLGIRGRYLNAMALPDRWVSWCLGAVPAGLGLVRRFRPDALWTTYPIATAHLIGLALRRMRPMPWIADFRDSMVDDSFPHIEVQRKAFRWLERRTVSRCDRAVFTTPGALRMYRERYPDLPADRLAVIENAYDEENFSRAGSEEGAGAGRAAHPRVLVHSGVLYRNSRDTTRFYQALAALKASGRIDAGRLRVVLRATGDDAYQHECIARAGIEELVRIEPSIPYEQALSEMLQADGLLVLQASNCNHQIPAKAYEYLRARRPIFALTDSVGDTASMLRGAGIDTIAPLDDAPAITRELGRFLDRLDAGTAPLPSEDVIKRHSRHHRARELAAMLDQMVGVRSGESELAPH